MNTRRYTPIAALLWSGVAASAAVSTDVSIESSTPGSGDGFGVSVAIGDPFVVVGAPTDDDVASNAGTVSVFFPDPTTGLPSTSIIEAPLSLSAGAAFGATVAADLDTFAVAAPAQHNPSGSPIGAVYVYTVGPSSLTLEAVLQPSGLIPSDLFGQDVDIVGDTIAVGAPGSGGGEGSVFIFNRVFNDWNTGTEIIGPHGEDGDGFGWTVALDHDDEKRLAIGAPWDSGTGFEAGRVHVYELGGGGWSPGAEIDSTDLGSSTNRLGLGLDFEGDNLSIGEPLQGTGRIHAMGWIAATSSWGLIETLEPTTTASYAMFGESLALSGDLLAVGVPLSDLNGTLSGAGYLFRLVADGNWDQIVELEDAYGQSGFNLGAGVACTGGIMALGSPGATAGSSTIQGGRCLGWDVSSTPGCPSDLEMTGHVDADDLMALINAWGSCTDPWGCPEDVDESGAIDVQDLLILLTSWGGC